MLVSLKLKEIINLFKTNKDLTHTIQTILQVFPEGVIIRSLDETSRQTILKFSNNIANKVLVDQDKYNQGQSIMLKTITSNKLDVERESEDYFDLEQFLKNQENTIVFEDRA